MENLRIVTLSILVCFSCVRCDSTISPSDTNGAAVDARIDAPSGTDLPARDLTNDSPAPGDSPMPSDSPAPNDLTTGTQKLGQGCCKSGASGCTLGSCESNLSCYIVPGGPYTDRGICTKACSPSVPAYQACKCPSTTPTNLCPGGMPVCHNGTCMWHCLPGAQGCDSSQPCKCNTGMQCLSASSQTFCLP